MTAPAPSLSALLGELPPAVAALPEAERHALAELVLRARDRQARTTDQATEVALKGVPLPVRGLIRKALLG